LSRDITIRYAVRGTDDEEAVVGLIDEYLRWMALELKSKMQVDLPKSMFAEIRASLGEFWPPRGRLLVAQEGSRRIVGTGAIRSIDSKIGEIKRMYLKPEARGEGIGGKLLDRLILDAAEMKLSEVRLSSGPFTTRAHALYRSRGFQKRDYYQEAEPPREFSDRWLFFERKV
jgi:ribosomal protein S18 acetylase RimI-like enzyme